MWAPTSDSGESGWLHALQPGNLPLWNWLRATPPWWQHKPSLASPELRILEWKDIQPETIPSVLQTHLPVRWNCYVAETHTA